MLDYHAWVNSMQNSIQDNSDYGLELEQRKLKEAKIFIFKYLIRKLGEPTTGGDIYRFYKEYIKLVVMDEIPPFAGTDEKYKQFFENFKRFIYGRE